MSITRAEKKHEKRFLCLFLISSAIMILLIISANIIINPRSEFGTTIFKPLIRHARSEKIEMMKALPERPELIVLGSSNSMKLNCSLITSLTGESCFNAAVDAARIEDYYALLSYIIEDLGFKPKTLILGLNIEAFSDSLEIDPRLISEKRLYSKIEKPILPPEIGIIIDSMSPYYLIDSFTVLKYTLVGYPAESSHYEKDGQGVYDQWDSEIAAGNFSLEEELGASINNFVARLRYMNAVSHERKAYLEKILDTAKNGEMKVLMFIPTTHSSGIEVLKKETKYSEMRDELKRYLEGLKEEYDFTYIDASEASLYGGNPDGFYDVSHINGKNAEMIIRKMIAQYNEEHPQNQLMPKTPIDTSYSTTVTRLASPEVV